MNEFFRKTFRIYPRLRQLFYKHYNRLFFLLLDIKYGKNLQVLNKIYVRGKGKIIIGDNLVFTSGDGLNPLCRNIRGMFFTATNGEIHIGDNVGISSACLRAQTKITIGDNVNIGADCLITDTDAHPHNYMQRRRDTLSTISRQAYEALIPSGSIVIEDDVWIGTRCIILKGVHIGARSIIAAGSVVVKDIPADCIAGGNPCKVIRLNVDSVHQ